MLYEHHQFLKIGAFQISANARDLSSSLDALALRSIVADTDEADRNCSHTLSQCSTNTLQTMVIIWKVFARYEDTRGNSYSELGYYLSRAEAYANAIRFFDKRPHLSTCNKMIIQEISINANGCKIRDTDYITE